MGVGIARGADAYRSADRVAFDRNPVGVARDAPLAVGDHGEERTLSPSESSEISSEAVVDSRTVSHENAW